MKLSELNVSSFTTQLSEIENKTIAGGTVNVNDTINCNIDPLDDILDDPIFDPPGPREPMPPAPPKPPRGSHHL